MATAVRLMGLVGMLCGLAAPARAVPLSETVELTFGGETVGVLAVADYVAGRVGDQAAATISANFLEEDLDGDPLGPPGAGRAAFDACFDHGLAFMQTVEWDLDSGAQQRLFRDRSGGDLVGTFSDGPQLGFLRPDGSVHNGADDTPWYGSTGPTTALNAAGEPPATFQWDKDGDPANGDEFASQFFDGPRITFSDTNGFQGLASLLNGRSGSIRFETALVGIKETPGPDNPNVAQTDLLNGEYEVVVLKTFRWDIDVLFLGSALDGLSAEDYLVTNGPLEFFDDVSPDFEAAFDGGGPNGSLEWLVTFSDPACCVPEPSASALLLSGLAAASTAVRRRGRVRFR